MRNNKPQEVIYIYGKHASLSALCNPKRKIKNIFCTEDIFALYKKTITQFRYEISNMQSLTKLLGNNQIHQGIVLKLEETIFLSNINELDLTKPKCTIAILDQITDPQNIGAIIRSAAAFDVDAIIMASDNAPNENGTIAKAASGTLEIVPIVKVVNLVRTMEQLKKLGFWIIGMDGKSGHPLDKKICSDKVAIVLGSEDSGMRPLVKKTCDFFTKIAISDKVESLNVSNAASIMFHFLNNG